jgi:hypothetical protein
MNPTSVFKNVILSDATPTTIKVKKARGPYGPRQPKLKIVEEEESSPEPEPEEVEEEVEEEVVEEVEVEVEVEEEEEEEPLPEMESDPIVLRALVADLRAEVVRLTKYNQTLQTKLEGRRRQPKKMTEKEAKKAKEGKRKVTRAKRPEDYAQQYMEVGKVLKWKHIKRNCWAEATYVGAGKFSARYSFTEDEDEALTLHAIGLKMCKHLTISSVNAWTTFKDETGKSVGNLDL